MKEKVQNILDKMKNEIKTEEAKLLNEVLDGMPLYNKEITLRESIKKVKHKNSLI